MNAIVVKLGFKNVLNLRLYLLSFQFLYEFDELRSVNLHIIDNNGNLVQAGLNGIDLSAHSFHLELLGGQQNCELTYQLILAF